ncbi:MAG: alpha/beta hydrolase [Alphaproteobacteria bacterium]|nr:alpha/beta hydrolase [Alphaproteobacteria bacterium]
MAMMQRGDLSIYYETRGKGFPLLLIAPGGMTSVISFWARSAFNPIEIFSQDYWTIAMDQRNSGKSSGPLDMDDPWGSYADDQLELMNCLGAEKFFVLGCCIGCCFALKLIERAPDRVVAAVLEQPVGQDQENRDVLAENLYRRWVAGLAEINPGIDQKTAVAFGEKMCGGDFVLSVSREFVKSCTTPMLVMPGDTLDHPRATAEEIAALAPNVEFVSQWRYPSSATPAAVASVRRFLAAHVPAD